MQLPIFFDANIVKSDAFIVNEETSKHCIQVLRMHASEQLQITNGKGFLYTCTIVAAHKKNMVVVIDKEEFVQAPVTEKIIAISILKNTTRLEWFIEKAVELGITAIVPLLCSRTEKQQFKYERFQNIIVSAMLQSQQYWLPTLHKPTEYKLAIQQFTNLQAKYIAHCYNTNDKLPMPVIINTNCIVFIGPEGDFTVPEVTLANTNNYTAITLGNTRLRTETAALKAAVLVSM
jgi:16S rRNA (uracil1498-N3)-methyltransferase